jgi:hypothetical protein
VDGRLHVVAHVSEPIDKYVLSDGPSLAQFVQLEMVEGLHQAVEHQLIDGDGTGENLRGIANTSGIQTQPLVTDAILTARSAITKVEVLGFTPYYFVMIRWTGRPWRPPSSTPDSSCSTAKGHAAGSQ